ncbi:MAG: hypothetical protein JSR21_12490 [Proteobacteria bacterium]|nr:hypothetical protein [Pseudomonadota bacterium]
MGQPSSYVYAGVGRTKPGGLAGIFRRPAQGGAWEHVFADAEVQAITVHPSDRGIVFAGAKGGVLRSDDAGATWSFRGFPETGAAIWSVMVHPDDPSILLAGASPIGVFRSEDGGKSWRRMPDPRVPERVAMPFPCRVMRFASRPGRVEEIFAALEVNGVMRSTDLGESWEDCGDDLQRQSAEPHLKSRIASDSEAEGMLDSHAIAMTPAAPQSTFLAVRMGLFASADDGAHWRDMGVGRFSPLTYGRDLRVSQHDPRVLYACLSAAAFSEQGSLYRSDDVGETWRRFDRGIAPASTVMAVALDAADAASVHIATRGGQVFGTLDGGATWSETRLPPETRDVYALACG